MSQLRPQSLLQLFIQLTLFSCNSEQLSGVTVTLRGLGPSPGPDPGGGRGCVKDQKVASAGVSVRERRLSHPNEEEGGVYPCPPTQPSSGQHRHGGSAQGDFSATLAPLPFGAGSNSLANYSGASLHVGSADCPSNLDMWW